jgi:hypothetical protein
VFKAGDEVIVRPNYTTAPRFNLVYWMRFVGERRTIISIENVLVNYSDCASVRRGRTPCPYLLPLTWMARPTSLATLLHQYNDQRTEGL